MLQHNVISSDGLGKPAHVAHAAMIVLHTLCCGAPVALALVTALAGASSGLVLVGNTVSQAHNFLHQRELALVAVSAALVLIGGMLEWRARRPGRSIPRLFLVSLACFFFNLTLLGLHRLG